MTEILEIPTIADFSVLKNYAIYTTSSKTDLQRVIDIPVDIKPIEGRLFFKRPNIYLQPEDWVIFGVASTPNVDLVNDAILDMEATFGDSLKEFVETGKIFYEHGYKHSGKEGYLDEIDVPLGIPVAAEIANNQLYVWILLNKSHPLSKKVYNALVSAKDERIKNSVFGLSIGAIPEGKTEKRYINGKQVNVPSKMRLYEVSITGQPINTSTWVDLYLKSLNINAKIKADLEESMDEKEKDELTQLLKDLEQEEKKEDKAEENPEKEVSEVEEVLKEDEEQQEDKEDNVELAESADLLTEDEAEAQEKEIKEEASDELKYLLDKIDTFEEKLAKFEKVFNEILEREVKEHEDLKEELSELKNLVLSVEKSISSLNLFYRESMDYEEATLNVLGEVKSLVSELFTFTKSLGEYVEQSTKNTETALKSLSQKLQEKSEEKKEVVVKSLPVLGANTEAHPVSVAELSSNIEKVNQIFADKNKLKSLYNIFNEYRNFKGNPLEISRKKEETVQKIKSLLSLTDDEAEYLFKELKKRVK